MPPQSSKQRIIDCVQSGEFPRYLYKYRPLYHSAEPLKMIDNTTSIITEAQLWHSAPTSFNDPFDCQIALDQRHSDAIVRSMAKLYATAYYDGQAQRKVRRKGLMNLRRNTRFTVDRAQKYVRDAMAATGLCSYGIHGDNLLMWSHYGDSHRGVCLKFDVLAHPEAYIDMMPVAYSSEYPSLRGIDEASIHQVLTVKANAWAYEQEWRVFSRSGPGAKSFRKTALVEIILGANAAAAPVEAFIDLLDADSEYDHVEVRQAKLSKRSFALELVDY
jgi:hypothetical protein